MNHLAMVNKVLKRMREAQVASVDENDYSALIGDFVEQAVEEVEDAWDWNALRTTIQVTTSAAVFQYALTGAGHGYRILCVFNDTDDYELRKAPSSQWMTHMLLDDNAASQDPEYYDVNGVDANGDPIVDMYPIPDSVQTINFNMKVKTAISDDTSETPVPWLPCVLLATMMAVEERGDDAGLSLEFLQARFKKSLADNVAMDAGNHEEEMIWEVE